MEENKKDENIGRDKNRGSLTREGEKKERHSREKTDDSYIDRRRKDDEKKEKIQIRDKETKDKKSKEKLKRDKENKSYVGETIGDNKKKGNTNDAKKKAEDYGLMGGKNKGKGTDDAGKRFNGKKVPNLLSYKSVKKELLDGGIDEGTKHILDKFAMGSGSIAEKINKFFTGKDKVEYSKKMTVQGKFVIVLIALVIVTMAWMAITVSLLVILFGAVYLMMDGGDMSGGTVKPPVKQESNDSGLESGKYKDMPPELQGKFLTPNVQRWGTAMGTRKDPITGAIATHKGVDMGLPNRAIATHPIYALAPGKVISTTDKFAANKGSSWGNSVSIEHEGGITSLYGHFQPGLPVKVGDTVGITTIIGIMGNTGYSAGNHVHVEMFTGGKAKHKMASNRIDPMKYMSCTETTLVPPGLGVKMACYNYQKKVRGI